MKRAFRIQFVPVLLVALLLVGGLSGSVSASVEDSAVRPEESHSLITSPCPSIIPHCLPPPSPPITCDALLNAPVMIAVGDEDVHCERLSVDVDR